MVECGGSCVGGRGGVCWGLKQSKHLFEGSRSSSRLAVPVSGSARFPQRACFSPSYHVGLRHLQGIRRAHVIASSYLDVDRRLESSTLTSLIHMSTVT